MIPDRLRVWLYAALPVVIMAFLVSVVVSRGVGGGLTVSGTVEGATVTPFVSVVVSPPPSVIATVTRAGPGAVGTNVALVPPAEPGVPGRVHEKESALPSHEVPLAE